MATPEQIATYDALRANLGLSEAQLSNDQAAAILAQVAARYPAGSALVTYAAGWVVYLEGKASTLSDQTSYTQNQESVSQSDAFKANMQLLAYWQRKLDKAIEDDEDGTVGNIDPPPSGTVRLRPNW